MRDSDGRNGMGEMGWEAGMTWYNMVKYGMTWYNMVQHGMTQYTME